jgi:hypothetical protein
MIRFTFFGHKIVHFLEVLSKQPFHNICNGTRVNFAHYFDPTWAQFKSFQVLLGVWKVSFAWMQVTLGYEVATTISQTMDLLETNNTQSLANSLHEFLEYQKCLQPFNEADNEHKDLLR